MTHITFIGAGNVAGHLAKAFFQKGLKINQVFSRKIKNAAILANAVEAKAVNYLFDITTDADLYIIAVKDDAIGEVAAQLPKNINVAHTSGSVDLDVLENKDFNAIGVFYPLQSFTKNKKIDFAPIPFCLEADKIELMQDLKKIAGLLSDNVIEINSEQREIIHLAAVFANNFTNLMYAEAAEIMQKNKLPFDILLPLIKETADKISKIPPNLAQTGPARRNDNETIKKHLAQLDDDKLKAIYSLLSDRVKQKFSK